MSMFGLIWANLFRKRTRTTLTLLSLVIAFLLFVLLRAIAAAFAGGVSLSGMDRLVVQGRYSRIDDMPVSHLYQIQGIDGVELVTHRSWFGGVYQDPKNFFAQFSVQPLDYFAMYEELQIEPAVLEKFARTRTGAVAMQSLVEEYGWRVGDMIPLDTTIWQRDDGTTLWEFELLGTFVDPGRGIGLQLMLIHHDYVDEAAAFRESRVGGFLVRVEDSDRAAEISAAIDDLFKNSSDPTRTATEDESNRQMANSLGDIGFITTMILGAVFFTIVLLTGNTMAQSLRERIPEIAVLKTLGFTDLRVSWLMMGEALLLCAVGGTLGVGLAILLEPGLNQNLSGFLGRFEMTWQTIATALGLALLVGVVIGLLPAVTAKRLTIADALRKG